MCLGARVKGGSIHVTHSAATQLTSELDYLLSNHSDVIKAEEEANRTLENARKNHTQLQVKIEQQKTINEGYQRQIEALQKEKTSLQANVSSLGEQEFQFVQNSEAPDVTQLFAFLRWNLWQVSLGMDSSQLILLFIFFLCRQKELVRQQSRLR